MKRWTRDVLGVAAVGCLTAAVWVVEHWFQLLITGLFLGFIAIALDTDTKNSGDGENK